MNSQRLRVRKLADISFPYEFLSGAEARSLMCCSDRKCIDIKVRIAKIDLKVDLPGLLRLESSIHVHETSRRTSSKQVLQAEARSCAIGDPVPRAL